MRIESLPHLETFTEAAERSSFTRAARALGLTQAAVSQRIHALERELGVPLFHRTGGKVELTDAGRRLHEYARRILDLHREARREVAGKVSPVVGELVIAASSIPGEHLLPTLLAAFGASPPTSGCGPPSATARPRSGWSSPVRSAWGWWGGRPTTRTWRSATWQTTGWWS